MKITDKDGKEVEVFSVEEVDKKLSEAAQEAENKRKELETNYEIKIKDVSDKINSLEDEKSALEAKISGGGGEDHPNFRVLKDALDKKEAEIEGLTKSINLVNKQRVDDYLATEIIKAAGDDDEVAKKIRHHFNETLKSMPNESKEEILARIEAAKVLSGINNKPSPLDNIGGSGFFPASNAGATAELSEKEKALGRKMGLTEEDYKKYAPKTRKDYGK